MCGQYITRHRLRDLPGGHVFLWYLKFTNSHYSYDYSYCCVNKRPTKLEVRYCASCSRSRGASYYDDSGDSSECAVWSVVKQKEIYT